MKNLINNVKLVILILSFNVLTAVEAHCGSISADESWSAADEHLLTCQTFVEPGVTLTIEAGTIVKSLSDDGAGLAPALVVKQGGMIMAAGTADAPITFTADASAEDLAANPRGNWGGVIINGYAPISTTGGINEVEGLSGVSYGGSDPEDNSGVLSYVRVWHGGRSIGQDNEINGITLAGVGSGTTVEYSEVAWNLDDGFEMFGGTVNLHHCSVVNVGDDAFDTDEGYQGKGQFLFVHRDDASDKAHEMDNKTNSDFDSQPRSHPMFSNVTVMGGAEDGLRLREGTGGDFRNYIVSDVGGEAIRNDANGSELVTQDFASTAGLYPDYLYISPNTLMWNIGGSGLFQDFEDSDTFAGNAIVADAGLDIANLDITPNAGGSAYSNVDGVADAWFTQTNYKGAFAADSNWLDGLSILSGSFMETESCSNDGDVSDDGFTNVLDVVAIVQYVVGSGTLTEDQACRADINEDTFVNVLDVVAIVQSIVNGRDGAPASSVEFIRTSQGLEMNANGVVDAVQLTLSHGDDFSIELTDNAFVAEYSTKDNQTTLMVVAPEGNEIFTASGEYTIDEMIAANKDGYVPTSQPVSFNLSEAYPNPFNPSTSLEISLNVASNVSITAYNVMGQLVSTIHDGNMDAGTHAITWNASNLASGMYIVIANVGGGSAINKKVMLVK